MARDFKNLPRSKPAVRRKQAPRRALSQRGWPLFIAVGVLFIGFLYWLQQRPMPVLAAITPASIPEQASPPAPSKAPSPAPPTAAPRFDFYTILPEQEVPVSSEDPRRRVATGGVSSLYVLQVGSFRSLSEADALKSHLLSLGLDARVESVEGVGQDTWHRVRLGPFHEIGQVQALRARLAERDIYAIPLRVKS